ncbi:hypothetical protein AB3S75_018571 [Citrus x aurantiifolia]
MANVQEKVSCMSPLKENGQEGEEDFDDDYENTVSEKGHGCDCFGLFSFKTRRRGNEYNNLLHEGQHRLGEPWWNEKLKKVKEVSELCAGPKWKNFIRKTGRFFSFKRNKHNNYQYDPQSYALNFDGGFDRDGDDFAS